MDPILDLANKHNLFVIEDACQAHGATYKGRKVGSMGHLGAFSFYFSKNLGAYGEGGMVTASDPELAHTVRMMRDHGSDKRYIHEMLGWNGRLDELQAAVLRVKLPHLDAWNDQRRHIANFYTQELRKLGVITPVEMPHNRHVYHLYVIRTPKREALRIALGEKNIGSGIHYPIPIHKQKVFADCQQPPDSLAVTEQVVGEILSLPIYPELTLDQAGHVIDVIRNTFA
jgi:dTDP-4-amino-4,6-dideoxygalactose transaminase